jgi:hypothetical protein
MVRIKDDKFKVIMFNDSHKNLFVSSYYNISCAVPESLDGKYDFQPITLVIDENMFFFVSKYSDAVF